MCWDYLWQFVSVVSSLCLLSNSEEVHVSESLGSGSSGCAAELGADHSNARWLESRRLSKCSSKLHLFSCNLLITASASSCWPGKCKDGLKLKWVFHSSFMSKMFSWLYANYICFQNMIWQRPPLPFSFLIVPRHWQLDFRHQANFNAYY